MKENHLLFLVTLILLVYLYISISGGERYEEKPKYLLIKGWCGFADRLQCMSAALVYAKKHKRIVCVDWTDVIWKGETPNMNFDTFFDFTCEGISTIPLDELLAKQNELSIYPPPWKGQLEKKPDLYMYEKPYQIDLDADPKHDEDILVYTCTELRTYNRENICDCLRIKEPFRSVIIEKLKHYQKYKTVVHLRGSDRVKPEQYEEYLKKNFESKMKDKTNETVLIVSDTESLFKYFQEKYPNSIVRTPNTSYTSSSDPIKTLHHDGSIDKYDFNTQTLIDFFIIMYANECIHDENSLFSNVPRFIRSNDDKYKQILNY
jgi:hypothetical protein